jgi:hypothetical protein
MSIQSKDRFVENNLRFQLGNVDSFPPPVLTYAPKNLELFLLGESNKNDLMPINIDTLEMQAVVTYGAIKQCIYTAESGDLYDVCVYKNKENEIFIYGIRTRQLPEKKAKAKAKQ